MTHLHERIAPRVDAWRADDYPCDDYPAIAEIFEWARDPEIGALRFLRPPQLRALETYWYLRLVQETPHIFDLYKRLYPPDSDLPGLLEGLGVSDAAFRASNYAVDTLWQRVRTDDRFVQDFRLQALRETLTLSYPSYILALAMGAGKTNYWCHCCHRVRHGTGVPRRAFCAEHAGLRPRQDHHRVAA